jgi:hypothetical protein
MTDAPFPARALRHIETDIGLRFGGGNMSKPAFAQRVDLKVAELFGEFQANNATVLQGAQPPTQMRIEAEILVIGEMLDEILARIG